LEAQEEEGEHVGGEIKGGREYEHQIIYLHRVHENTVDQKRISFESL